MSATTTPRVGTTERRQFAAKVDSSKGANIRVVLTDGSLDRDKDRISVRGWRLDNYLKSPVVLWAHDYSQLPIARAKNLIAGVADVRTDLEFPPRGIYPFADQVHDYLRAGFLNTVSVGFNPLRWEKNAEGGVDFLEQELLEFSVVPVPANPSALVVSRSADTNAVRQWLGLKGGDEIVLRLRDDEPAAGITREDALIAVREAIAAELRGAVSVTVRRELTQHFADPFTLSTEKEALRDGIKNALRDAASSLPQLVRAELLRRSGRVD